MAPTDLLKSIQDGIGSTLGGLVLVLALGIMLGSILTETGAAQVISARLLRLFGPKRANLALLITGFVVGLPCFTMPVLSCWRRWSSRWRSFRDKPWSRLAISMAAPLSVTHGFLPPHPGATNIANLFGADLGKTLLLGLVVAIPAIFVAGIVFPKYFLKNIRQTRRTCLAKSDPWKASLPGLDSKKSGHCPAAGAFDGGCCDYCRLNLPGNLRYPSMGQILGRPGCGDAAGGTGWRCLFFAKKPLLQKSPGVSKSASCSINPVSRWVLLRRVADDYGAGGAFKQVLLDSGLGQELAGALNGISAFTACSGLDIATLLRIAIGSATVAGTTGCRHGASDGNRAEAFRPN